MEQFVIEAIKKILVQDKVPSVALIKGKLSQAVPMPIIISVLGQYKNDPDNFKIDQQKQKPQEPSINESQTQLDRIENKLDLLLTLLQDSKKAGNS